MVQDAMANHDHDKLDRAAQAILDWVSLLDPTWGERIAITIAEHPGWQPRQVLGNLVALPLEFGLHMQVLDRAEFQPAFQPLAGRGTCEVCEQLFTPMYAGQRYDTNACARLAAEKRGEVDLGTVMERQAPGFVDEADLPTPEA